MKFIWDSIHVIVVMFLFVCGYGAARASYLVLAGACILLLLAVRAHYLGGINENKISKGS